MRASLSGLWKKASLNPFMVCISRLNSQLGLGRRVVAPLSTLTVAGAGLSFHGD
jgi:hypothetical protein